MYSWQKLFGYPFQEYSKVPLKTVSGNLPETLRGVMFRNTSVFLPRSNQIQGHWFDGDGAILRVEFKDGKANASYQFIKNQGFLEEQQLNRYYHANLGRTYEGNFFTRALNSLNIKNTANTSVYPLQNGPLLALVEGSWPTALHPDTLNTIGTNNLGKIPKSTAYSAHPKVCPDSGLIYNIGMSRGRKTYLMVSETSQEGKMLRSLDLTLRNNVTMVHDFVLCGKYLVVLVYPNVLEGIQDVLLGRKSIAECTKFRPQQGTEIFVVDRNTMQLVSNNLEETQWYTWHYSNGYVENDGKIIVEQVAYPDFNSFYMLGLDQMLSKDIPPHFDGVLERLEIEPSTAKITSRQKLYDDFVEFPVVHDDDVGKKHSVTYAALTPTKNDIQSAVVRYENGKRIVKQFEVGQYTSEALYIQDPTKDKHHGWLASVVFDGNKDECIFFLTNSAYIRILDSQTLDEVCDLQLPDLIPLGFHGRFQAAN